MARQTLGLENKSAWAEMMLMLKGAYDMPHKDAFAFVCSTAWPARQKLRAEIKKAQRAEAKRANVERQRKGAG